MLTCDQSSEVAISRICNVNPAHGICGNELDGNGFCLNGPFVPEDVHVVATGVEKRHPRFVHTWLAVGIVPFIVRYMSKYSRGHTPLESNKLLRFNDQVLQQRSAWFPFANCGIQ